MSKKNKMKDSLSHMQLELSILQQLLRPTKKEILEMRRLKFRIDSMILQIELQDQQ